MRVRVTLLYKTEYLLFVVDRASILASALPLSSKQAEGTARELLELCLTLGFPNVIRYDGGKGLVRLSSNIGAVCYKVILSWDWQTTTEPKEP